MAIMHSSEFGFLLLARYSLWIESDNTEDRFAVAVLKDDSVLAARAP